MSSEPSPRIGFLFSVGWKAWHLPAGKAGLRAGGSALICLLVLVSLALRVTWPSWRQGGETVTSWLPSSFHGAPLSRLPQNTFLSFLWHSATGVPVMGAGPDSSKGKAALVRVPPKSWLVALPPFEACAQVEPDLTCWVVSPFPPAQSAETEGCTRQGWPRPLSQTPN